MKVTPFGPPTFSLIDSVDAGQTSDPLYGLAPGTSYIFQVTSVDASGESALSNDTDPLTSPALPATPTGLTATLSAGDAVLNWTGDATLSTGYNIYESTDGGNTFTYLDSTAAGTTTYTATTDQLTAGTAYVFQVTAVDASGETSASSNADFTAPTAPTNVAVTLSPDATSATVTWEPGDSLAEGYIITRTPDDGSSGTVTVATLSGNATSLFADTGLDPTQAYTYTVTPYYTATAPASGDPTGTGVSASADTYTGNIENFAVTSASGSGTADLTWQYQGSDSFEIEEQDTGAAGTNYATIATPGGRSWDDLGLTPGDTYNFRIRADHSDGTASDYSTQSITLPGPTATITASNDADSATPNIALNYSADLSPSGDPVSYYNIQWYNNAAPGTGWVGLGLFPGSTSSQEVGVQAMETGSFRVQASYADGTLSQWSPTATATSGYGSNPPADPSTVTPVTVTATAASDTSVALTYGTTLPAYAVGTAMGTYTVAYAPDSALCGAGATTQIQTLQSFSDSSGGGSTTITGLTPGVKYDFVVTVSWTTDGGNGSDESAGGGFGEAIATTTGDTAPAAPASITAAWDPNVGGQVDIHWQNTPGNETGFQLRRSTDNGVTWTNIGGLLPADQTSTTDGVSDLPAANAPASLLYDVEALMDGAASQPSPQAAPAGNNLIITNIVGTQTLPAQAPTAKELQTLIAKLAHDDPIVRDATSQALTTDLALFPAIRDDLAKAEADPETLPESVVRLKAILAAGVNAVASRDLNANDPNSIAITLGPIPPNEECVLTISGGAPNADARFPAQNDLDPGNAQLVTGGSTQAPVPDITLRPLEAGTSDVTITVELKQVGGNVVVATKKLTLVVTVGEAPQN